MRHKKNSSEKRPGFFLYAMDLARDMAPHPPEIRGVWISFLWTACFSKTPGSLTMTLEQWSRVFGTSVEKTIDHLAYIKLEDIGDVSDFKGAVDERICITNRRMVRDHDLSLTRAKCGKKGGKVTQKLAKAKYRANVKQNAEKEIETEEEVEGEFKERKEGMGEKKEVSKKSDHKVFVEHYFNLYKKVFGVKPIFGSKEGKLVKGLLEEIQIDELTLLLEKFFTSEDSFIRGSDYGIGAFKSKINMLRIESIKRPPPMFTPQPGMDAWLNRKENGRDDT